MSDFRKERCEILGEYICDNKSTVRRTAEVFGISKSTVHKDVTKILKSTNLGLFLAVQEILKKNKSERHIRGGLATKKKYELLRKKKVNAVNTK